jgi:hypothetical protein
MKRLLIFALALGIASAMNGTMWKESELFVYKSSGELL